ncbi:5-methyltetrahydropteroyltriglutamate--homocysteine methyltransferase-like [Asterias rubens]|uniref:5-methyltetrahydropteroyltriglutamate-- homocysteine methyltransferase-like n=1 Tax=Asterias rubens TaxID=7604 RepID=UPI001454F832|nr:5-methyltetrahydropteroyltriglutamate--homocysteine methyltransferase-like [Asterias rubens]
MPLKTTVIGSYPKPPYLDVPSWFDVQEPSLLFAKYGQFKAITESTAGLQQLHLRALTDVLKEQADIGIDVVTDGELDRESYVWYLCRHLRGISFDNLEKCSYRNGACVSVLPKVVGPIEAGDDCEVIVKKWIEAQAISSKPVKATIPGPFTIIGTTQNKFYSDEKQLSLDLVTAIQKIMKGLADAGCKHIQLDEPVFMRDVTKCLDYGIEHASKCIDGLGNDVTKTIHLCCGYPQYYEQENYMKAEPEGYFQIADAIDRAGFDEVSIEDAHCRNDLSLLRHFKMSRIILGSVTIASSKVESVDEIRERLKNALQFIPSDRLVVAPDCGLAFLPHDIMRQKLLNMVEAAKSLPMLKDNGHL